MKISQEAAKAMYEVLSRIYEGTPIQDNEREELFAKAKAALKKARGE